MTTPRYTAFLSYSHAADSPLVESLQRALQGFAKPWYRLRSMRVFRDKASLSADAQLWKSIESALASSQYLILCACPESASSPWVAREVEWWLENRPADRLLIAWTGGELAWAAGGVPASPTGSALPQVLQHSLLSEPHFVDLRWARGEKDLGLRHSRFRAAVLLLAATLLGREPQDLDGAELLQHRRKLRLAWGAAIALAVLSGVSVVAALSARNNAAEAERQSQLARLSAIEAQARRAQAVEERNRAFRLIEAAINRSALLPFDQARWQDGDAQALMLEAARHLDAMHYAGRVEVSASVGQFCTTAEGELAPPESPAAHCTLATSPTYAMALGQRYANALRELMLQAAPSLVSSIETVSYGSERPAYPYPERVAASAGEWNAVALRNNRLSIRIVEK